MVAGKKSVTETEHPRKVVSVTVYTCPELNCKDNKNGICTFEGMCARKSYGAGD